MSPDRPRRATSRAIGALLSVLLGVGLLGAATPADAAYAKPTSLKAVSTATKSVRITWKASSSAPAYRVKYDDNSKMKSPSYLKTTSPVAEITKLKPGKTYWIKVRVISAKSKELSGYSSTIKVTTRKSGDFALLSPINLAGRSTSQSSISLSWSARAGAERYRVRLATSTKLTDERFWRVTDPAATITGLRPGTTYYASVRAITADGTNLSQYSPMVAIKTSGTAPPATPGSLTAKAVSDDSVDLSWKAITGASQYRVRYATTSAWSDVQYETTKNISFRLKGLQAETAYYVAVQSLGASGSASAFSTATKVTTLATSSPLRVASYNIRCHSCHSGAANEKPWVERRDAVAKTIAEANLDVVGLQEAQQSWLVDGNTGKKIDRSQFEDLVNRLGSPWALTNKHRNNCVKSTTPTNCVYKDVGASNGTKIIYRSDRLELISQGSKELPKVSSSSYPRYVAWATLRQKSSGREFLFANIHLEPLNDAGSSLTYHNNRKTQAAAVVAHLATINTKRLPVLLVGDGASSRADTPTNAPYDVIRGAGYIDPLGNVSKSSPPVGATVEKRINTNYNSFNAWESYARRSLTNVNGTYVDYIFTSPMRVSEWETVVKVDSGNQFVGLIPSDHNLIRATVWLP